MIVLYTGDSRAILRELAPASIDAVITDPPYELGFMGRAWDRSGVAFDPELWRLVLRALKPGGHLLAFGGTRTAHRMTCAIEDGGFEIRDSIAWLYGQGFPKSLDVSKAIDKAAGAEREVVGSYRVSRDLSRQGRSGDEAISPVPVVGAELKITAPATPEAARWSGWGTALKPAHEPITVARKPLEGTVADNVQRWGTGAINVDACRIEAKGRPLLISGTHTAPSQDGWGGIGRGSRADGVTDLGRWPANVTLDEHAAAELDEQSGDRPVSGAARNGRPSTARDPGSVARGYGLHGNGALHADAGGASRFFYCAKASSAERKAGVGENPHPTVKPIALLRWLVRLVVPAGGVVLDPFCGSGSTGCAVALEGREFVGCELDPVYTEIARKRIEHWGRTVAQVSLL